MSFRSLITGIPDIAEMDAIKERENILDFCDIGRDILTHPRYEEMKGYNHHGEISCHYHTLFVSYVTYKACTHTDCNTVEATRAAMLHDFYLYDWHFREGRPYEKGWHAFKHPVVALQNAEKYFELNDLQRDIILHHMWPFFLSRPKTKEGFSMVIDAAILLRCFCLVYS